MQETQHYKFKKPGENDYADISVLNLNADVIDAALHGLEEGKADLDPVTHKVNPDQLPTMNYEAPLKDASAKAYPVDNDGIVLVDNADSKTKRVMWSSIKTTLKTWLDTLYASVTHSHAWGAITGKPTSFSPVAHAASHKTGGADALAPGDIGAAPASHVEDTVKHVTAVERTEWNGKLSRFPLSSAAYDFNAILAEGRHERAAVAQNGPYGSGGYQHFIIDVYRHNDLYLRQVARAATTDAAYERVKNNGTWGPWRELPKIFAPVSIVISTAWTGSGPWTQSIAVAGVLAAWDWRLRLHLAKITDDAARKLQEKAFACITWCETYDGGITLTCRDKKPDVAISAVLAGEV